jgi:hypothetical protein
LYYNPLATTQSVGIDLGTASQYDLYDAVSNQYLARGRSGQTFFNIPSDEAVQLVLIPSGGTETRQGRKLAVNGVVIDYNATLLPNNIIRNPDVDTALTSDVNHPAYWHYSSNAVWSSQQALSPSHSLGLVDNSTTTSEEWRTYSTSVTPGTNRQLLLRWFWKYSTSAGDTFRARLRLSNDQVTTLDLTNPAAEFDYTVSGTTADFQMFETTISLPDGVQSLDLTFLTGGAASALGSFYIDDISAEVLTSIAVAGDYNHDGVVNAADYALWRNSLGTSGTGLAADGNGDGVINQLDYDIWREHFGQTSGSGAAQAAPVPEPSSLILFLFASFAGVTALIHKAH